MEKKNLQSRKKATQKKLVQNSNRKPVSGVARPINDRNAYDMDERIRRTAQGGMPNKKKPRSRAMIMKKRRRLIISGIVGILVFLICIIGFSCAKGKKLENATENTLYIGKAGTVTEAIVEDWTENYLKAEELEAFIKEELEAFQKENEDSKIKLEKFDVEDGKAKVTLTYDSVESYAKFNQVTAFAGSVEEAEEDVWIYQDELISAKGKASVQFDDLKGTDYTIYLIFDHQKVCTEKEILYANEGVEISKDGKTAMLSDVETGSMYLVCK